MSDSLPSQVDVIVLGTGLPESVLAGACSRAGLSVLHLDRNNYYGGVWSSFNLKSISDWAENQQVTVNNSLASSEQIADKLTDGEELIILGRNQTVKNVKMEWTAASETYVNVSGDTAEGKTIRSELEQQFRKFSIDLVPKVLLARGSMVLALCDSEVAKYAEFKCVDRFLSTEIQNNGHISFQRVPCTKSEIFQSNSLSLIDKRRLMDFLSFCADWNLNPEERDGWQQFADKPFADFLASRSINNTLQRIITDTIGILHPHATTEEGLTAVCRFVDSAGKFGASPFLCPLYGCGELPQCFCRLCAVFGGIYCLGRSVDAFVLKDSRIVAVIADNQRIECSHVIAANEYLPSKYVSEDDATWIDRHISIVGNSILAEDKEHISIANLPQIDGRTSTRLLEIGFEACVAPKGYYLAHLTGRVEEESSSSLQQVVDKLFSDTSKPFWTLSFSIQSDCTTKNLPVNLIRVPGPDYSPDLGSVVDCVKNLFVRNWPDLDFLPRSITTEETEND